MPSVRTSWSPLPHGPLEKVADNLWRVRGELPHMPLGRVLTAVRLLDGRLVLHNAIALEEPQMAELEAWGRPALMIVPNGWHRLDARAYKDRYPELRVLCPRGATRKVSEVVPVDGSYDDLDDLDDLDAGDEAIRLFHLRGIEEAEGVLQVRSEDGTTLVFNDVIFNQPHQPGALGLLLRLIGSTGGGCRVTPYLRLIMVRDRRALRADLERLSRIDDLRRVIMSHGEMISAGAAAALAHAAAGL